MGILVILFTSKYEDYIGAEVQNELQALFDKQYEMELEEEVEIRTRTETRTGSLGLNKIKKSKIIMAHLANCNSQIEI